MGEVLFYHLTGAPVERSLPEMLEKALARGWRVVVRCGSEAGLGFLDAHLWGYRDDAFLPHGTAATGHVARQPVYLTCGEENPNDASVLMAVLGARAGPGDWGRYARVCLMFDGADAEAVAAARQDWRAVTAAGMEARYWAQEGGRWTEKARSGGAGVSEG
jgi:DNA polymerase III subunit chi